MVLLLYSNSSPASINFMHTTQIEFRYTFAVTGDVNETVVSVLCNVCVCLQWPWWTKRTNVCLELGSEKSRCDAIDDVIITYIIIFDIILLVHNDVSIYAHIYAHITSYMVYIFLAVLDNFTNYTTYSTNLFQNEFDVHGYSFLCVDTAHYHYGGKGEDIH